MVDEESDRLRRQLTIFAAISSSRSKRANAEQNYYQYKKKKGIKVRGKYRP